MSTILPTIESPHDLQGLSPDELENLAAEMRQALCQVAASRTAHFASNLGVVELCLALHRVFDFSKDRLIWGHWPPNLSPQTYHGEIQQVRHNPDSWWSYGFPKPF